MPHEPLSVFDFNSESDLSNWIIMDDVVMGGRSDGNFEINQDGNGIFFGKVSLENNGGFSSVQYRFEEKAIQNYKTCTIHLKGDGKSYQFRIKSKKFDAHSYIFHFETTGEWETIEIPLGEMYPSFRGRKLDMPDFPVEEFSQISFLISNKKAENFSLELDWMNLSKV